MLGYPAYPTGDELQAFLGPVAAACGISLPASIDYAQRIDAARQKLEGLIGRTLLAVPGTRRFDPPSNPRGILDLRADLVSVTAFSLGGQSMAADTDFFLLPFNADQEGKPFRMLEFAAGRWFWSGPLLPQQRKSVSVTGPWGYSLTVPVQCHDAILAQGAINCYPELALAVSHGLQMRKEGDAEDMFARGQNNGPLLEEMKGWQLRVGDAVNNFVCVEVGL